ncbi:hypothetical protein PHYC_03399 [Phycisphaerales bacterium]|nr:hypothetical protein PHYC_03399 [Phycisphaerales bacterium]
MKMGVVGISIGALSLGLAAGSASAFPGPDVILRDIQSVSNHGAVGGIYGYSIGSHTCNIGTGNLHWTNNGSPGLAMNAYRLSGGRLVQIGLSNAKTACCAGAQTSAICAPTCNGVGGSQLGVGCLDVYSSGWNAGQGRLAPRSAINAWTGAFTGYSQTSGNAIYRRIQVPTAEIGTANFPTALYFVEGVYVGDDDAPNGNRNNNASYRRVTVGAGNAMTLTGTVAHTQPAILAWRANGGGAGIVDTSVVDGIVDVPSEGRFHTAYKVTNLGGGQYRYDFAVYNLSSDRSGGSLSIPVPAGVAVTNIGFSAPLYHSGEVFSNTVWTSQRTANAVVWNSPEPFATNANSNALRWGTMYNFWFEANQAPTAANATLGLFKPHTPQSVTFPAQGPSAPPCDPDVNCDGAINGFDIQATEEAVNGDLSNFCQSSADLNGDGAENGFDIETEEQRVNGAPC